jgi:nucleotide-binding universal stress UspA family protein
MPLLGKAGRVTVLTADEPGDRTVSGIEPANRLAGLLQAHRIETEAQCVVPGRRPLHEALLGAAHDVAADLLVMGAYGHSRVRELVFGGLTRQVLAECVLPVLLVH